MIKLISTGRAAIRVIISAPSTSLRTAATAQTAMSALAFQHMLNRERHFEREDFSGGDRRTRFREISGKSSQLVIAFLIGVALIFTNCDSTERVPPVAKKQAEEVTLAQLLSTPNKFDGALVRVISPCSIAFEGNALHLPDERPRDWTARRAIWLQLGWPVSSEVRALNHRYALVEGRFDSGPGGHEGAYPGSLLDISRIEESSPEAEADVRLRIGSR